VSNRFKTLHLGGSLLALLFGWLAAQMTSAVQYVRIYYRNFETAMCFQTSAVSISGTSIRRLTLMQALYSLFLRCSDHRVRGQCVVQSGIA
jgi:uncharacterized membrane protein